MNAHEVEWKPYDPDEPGGGIVIVRFWAGWAQTLDDQLMHTLAPLVPRYRELFSFRHCDVDRDDLVPWLRRIGLANIPTVGCLIDGAMIDLQVGLRPRVEWEVLFARWHNAGASP